MEPQTSPIPPTPKTNNSLVLIMSILLLVTVAIAGLFYFQIQKLSKELLKYQTQATPTPTATADPTADWKTYTNEKYSFSFKYPQNLSVRETSHSLGASFAPGSYKDLDFQNLPVISFYVFTNFVKGTTHQEFIKALEGLEGGADSGIQNIDTKNINDIQITQFSSRNLQAGSGGLDIKTIITLKSGILMVTLSNSEKDMTNTYNQILSTFKFLE